MHLLQMVALGLMKSDLGACASDSGTLETTALEGIKTSPSMPQPFSLFLASPVKFQVVFSAMQIRGLQFSLCVPSLTFLFKFPHRFDLAACFSIKE